MKKILSLLILIISTPLLAKHFGPDYDTRPRENLDLFAQRLSEQHQLKFLNSGAGSFIDSQQALWVISLTSNQMLTIEEGRQLAADIAYQFLKNTFQDPLFSTYCEIAKKGELKEEYIGFRLAFWDENTNRPPYPYLAQIRFADNTFHYYYAEPVTQKLQTPVVETLDSLQLPDYRNSISD